MISGERVVAILPARGGSKGVPRKNIREVAGKPLLIWSIEQARAEGFIDRIIVSTEDAEIADIALKAGVEVHQRLPEHATDESLVIESVRHLIESEKSKGETADIYLLLEPSSPLRAPGEMRQCTELLLKDEKASDIDSVATFAPAKLNPHRAWRIDNDGVRQFLDQSVTGARRQSLPDAYQLNGNVYAFRQSRMRPETLSVLFGKVGAVQVPKIRGFEIDDPVDLIIVETLLKQGFC